MNALLSEVLEAHGGLERWRKFTTLSATIVTGGELWGFKGLVQDADPRRMTIDLHREWGSVDPFGDPDWLTDFTPDRIAIVARDGKTIAERSDPRAAFTRPHPDHALGPAAPRLLQRLCAVDLPDHAVPVRRAGVRGRRDRSSSRGRRNLARPAGDVPGPHRHSQPRAGLLLRARRAAPAPRLPCGRRRRFRCGAAGRPNSSRCGAYAFPLDGVPTSAATTCARSSTPLMVSIDLTDFALR